jgi:hypothetical protein
MTGERCVPLELLENRDAVELGHHDVEQDKAGLELARLLECVLAIDCRDHLIALRVEANPQHF